MSFNIVFIPCGDISTTSIVTHLDLPEVIESAINTALGTTFREEGATDKGFITAHYLIISTKFGVIVHLSYTDDKTPKALNQLFGNCRYTTFFNYKMLIQI